MLGGVGATVGVASFVFTVIAWRIERRDRRAADREEREARLAQVELDHARFAAEQREREHQHHADITTVQLPHETREGERIYKFKLRNMGPGYSKHVRAWLQTTDGRKLGGLPVGFPLQPGDEIPFDARMPEALWQEDRPTLEVIVEWRNDQGRRETERSNLEFDYDV